MLGIDWQDVDTMYNWENFFHRDTRPETWTISICRSMIAWWPRSQIWSIYRVTPFYQIQSTLPTSFDARLKNDISIDPRGDNFIPDVPELPSTMNKTPGNLSPPSPLSRLYYFFAGRYGWRGIMIGRLCARANASTACWDTESVRIILPIDMKNLEETQC